MEHSVDTVIIGGGPAGMACALTLQKRGVSSLVVEKRAFPRPKTCGGMVTEKARILLGDLLGGLPEAEELDGIFCDVSNTLTLWDGERQLTRSTITRPLRFVRRETFDAFLAGAYRRAGGALLERCRWETIDVEGRCMTLTNGDRVRYRHLVAADGALSETREALGAPAPALGFCVETWVPAADLPLEGEVRIDFGAVRGGYAWLFPSGDAVCVGLGGVYDPTVRFDALLKEHLASLGLDPGVCPLRGAFLPYGQAIDPRGLPYGVMLIGDAGGFVDPVTGEGIYLALATGKAAAEAILGGGDVSRAFARRTAPFARMVREGNRARRFLYQPEAQARFKSAIEGKNGFVAYYCDQLVSTYTYPYRRLLRLAWDYKRKKK